MVFRLFFLFVLHGKGVLEMDRQSLYEIHQDNLSLLENELEQVKKMTQINLGKLYYEKSNSNIQGNIQKLEYDILSSTRLYTFLLCSWLEARLNKILYENSSVAFSDTERNCIISCDTMSDKWRNCLNMSVCKSYGFSFNIKQKDYSSDFSNGSDHLQYYQKVYTYLDDIKHAVTIRNRLAHGQWKTQLNNKGTNFAGVDVNNFFYTYDNIQKLDLLYNVYKIIAEIISSYVVYKDKILTDNFKKDLEKKIRKIDNFRQRIEKTSFEDYCQSFYRKECIERTAKKKLYKE